jgi:NTE family protein
VYARSMLLETGAWRPNAAALILAGAVAKGAYEAGALKVIAERQIPVRRIVAASSGALNGVAYAAGVRARREALAVQELVDLWRHRSRWYDVFSLSLGDLFGGTGISDQDQLLGILRESVQPSGIEDPAPIDLHIVVAPVNGHEGSIGDSVATTYERVLGFDGMYFDRPELLDHVFEAAVATAAFPGVFAPATVKANDVGPCFDGGIVNNNPIDYSLDHGNDAAIDTVIVIAPNPVHVTQPVSPLRGPKLVSQLVEMLINERLYRDLRKADAVNLALGRLEELARRKGWSAEDVEDIKAQIGWKGRRVLDIIQIRPLLPLPGDAFSGFFDRDDIEQSIQIGIQRASEVLDRVGIR